MTTLQKQFTGVAAVLAIIGLAACNANEAGEQKMTKQEQALSDIRAAGIEINKIALPPAVMNLEKGSYTATIPTDKGSRDCIVNVVTTTHNHKNIILDCK